MTAPDLLSLVRLAPALLLVGTSGGFAQTSAHPRFAPEIEGFVGSFKPGGLDAAGQAKALTPAESLKRLHVAEGYALELAVSEPVVRQPIDLRFDDRGRLWVVQYLQYPFPAGMTITSYDQYMRAEFDRISPPPPNHYRGADKITILEDRDGDGKYETHKNFVEGLNMATSIALGHGGVWVLQSPYLLFYPDRNGDDIPDGDPEVHLTGFGLEDTHSLASSLHWGPDGWLYGATGSTTNLEIQGIRLLGQGIWRYHPGTKVFEIFAEGGGNTFSFEFDQYGRAYSGTNYGATRGVHYVQGATYVKGWTKHGPAMNPFIFGFFEHMAHEGYTPRFAQTFIFYEGGLLPRLAGQIVVGMALTNRVQASQVFPDTSTFRTIDREILLSSDDRAFRPVDIEQGPDGCIYIADWSDVRIGHLNPHDTWDKSNGRIFRLTPKHFARPQNLDLRTLPAPDLIKLLSHSNRWYREHARQLLAVRPGQIRPLLAPLLNQNEDSALEALWVLNLRGEIDQGELRTQLTHPNEHVRRWSVRLLGDQGSVNAQTQSALVALARTESAVEVRSQLASSARRLPAGQAFPIIRQLLGHDEDADDKHLPLLIWWAIESKADTGREELIALMKDPLVWKTKIFSRHIAARAGMRYTTDQGPHRTYTLKQGVYSGWQIERSSGYLHGNLQMCVRLLAAAPTPEDADRVAAGMAEGLTGGRVEVVPDSLKESIARLWRTRPHTAALVTLAARLGRTDALAEAVTMVNGGNLKASDEQQLIELLAAMGAAETLPLFTSRLRNEKNEARRMKVLEALNGFDQAAAAETIFELYPTFGPRLQNVARRLLCEKASWSLPMLQRMNLGTFNPGVLSAGNLASLRAHQNSQITALLTSFQKNTASDPTERLAAQLYEQGRTTYNLICAACHHESGEGYPGLAPSLVVSPWVQSGEGPMIRIVLQGKENLGRRYVMPSLKNLDDGQIAAAITYVRREFGNRTGMVTPARVAEIRAATSDREKPWSDAELTALTKP